MSKKTWQNYAARRSKVDPALARLMPECPFFRQTNGYSRITCEGICDNGTVALACTTPAAYEIQWRTFCTNHYQNCELYHAAYQKYLEE